MMNDQDFQSIFKGLKFAWFGQRAMDCLGLEKYLNLDFILSCDYGWDTETFIKKGIKVFSIEKETYIRENWTSSFLDKIIEINADKISEYIKKSPDPCYVIAYSTSKALEELASTLNDRLKLIMPNPKIKKLLDDKFRFRKIVGDLKMPLIEGYIDPLLSSNYSKHINNLGIPFVLSYQFGSTGSGTFFVSGESYFNRICQSNHNKVALFSKYINGLSININAAVLGKKVIVSYPSVQLIGLPSCSNRYETFCGNDFGTTKVIPSSLIYRSQEYVFRIGKLLSSLGYQGIFGVDLIVDINHNIIYPIDLNPRFQNSTHLLTGIELLEEKTPLIIYYIAFQLGLIPEEDIHDEIQVDQKREVTQMILHNLADTAQVKGNVKPGIYNLSMKSLKNYRKETSLLDCVNMDEFLLTCAVPRTGTIVKPAAPILKIIVPQRVYDIDRGGVLPWASDICTAVYDALELDLE